MTNELDTYYITKRSNFDDEFRLRIHRAISWFKKSEMLQDDEDLRFITLWISFNAAYAKELSNGTIFDKKSFLDFINLIINADQEKIIQNIIWEKLPNESVAILNDKYTFSAFWKYQSGLLTEIEWENQFNNARILALKSVKNKNTKEVLALLFLHIYMLRNQVIHGNSTYNSKINREQLHIANTILGNLIPEIIKIMMKNHQSFYWGKPFFPPILE